MTEDQVKFEFLWLPYPDDLQDLKAHLDLTVKEALKVCNPLKRVKAYVNKIYDFPVFIHSVTSKIGFDGKESDKKEDKNDNSLFYSEFLFCLNCSIELHCNIQSTYESFLNLFCSSQSDKPRQELWLKFNYCHISESKLETKDELINLESFAFGNLCGLNTFAEHFSSLYSLQHYKYKISQVKVKFLHDYHRIELYFVVGKEIALKKRSSNTHCLHKLEVPYSALHTILLCKTKRKLIVYFKLLCPPLLYAVYQNNEDDTDQSYISFTDIGPHTNWMRTVDLYSNSPEFLRKEFSMNTVLKLEFKSDDYDPVMQIKYHYRNVQVYFSPIYIVPLSNMDFKEPIDNFDCYYALQCLLTLSFELVDQLQIKKEIESFQKLLKEEKNKNPTILCEALHLVCAAVSQGVILWFQHSVKHLCEKFCKKNLKTATDEYSEKNNVLPRNIVLIKRGIFTPTHLRLLPPNPQLKSRALRRCDPDFYLRISIRDVNLKQINFTLTQGSFLILVDDQKKSMKLALCRKFFVSFFKEPLLSGLRIGERCYEYVGSSTSQLKAHGLWFYSKDKNDMTASELKVKLGDIDQIHKVAKYMARKGQTFSQAMGNITVPQGHTNVSCPEEDIKGGIKEYLSLEDDYRPKKFLKEINACDGDGEDDADEPYIFSDGIGRISPEIAQEVYKALDVEDTQPCAMQIRYAGCKGMLVVDPRMTGKKIVFRESMRKFPSTDDSLEILKFSEKRCAFLNRPFITILEQLGVPKKNFVVLQKKMLQHLVQSMYYNEDACDLLNRNSLARFDFVNLFTVGMNFIEDPLFKSMIYSLIQSQLVLLKDKANIELPVNEARSMFGVVDETFTLEYGQVFVQYEDWDSNEKKILKGTVVVTKNPCMHPGDVRTFQAVDVESLHHICDCIVFPAKGHRPHPDEMAGSDLDGDEYHVIWMKDFIFAENKDPMHFATKKEELEERTRPVMASDELDHLCEYILTDNVGLIGSAHLAFADSEKNGIFSQICVTLAKHYAIALDFAKSGENVQHRHGVSRYPDFMQKIGEKSKTYLSVRALGELYRNCRQLQIGLLKENYHCEYRIDSDLIHESWEKYKKSALKSLKKYSAKVEYLMRTYNFESEGQLLAGAIINPPAVYEQRHDLDNMKALLEYEVKWIFREFERQFFCEFNGKPKSETYNDEMHQKASAWYFVTYNKVSDISCKYFGLPWSVADVLIDLKHKNIKYNKNRHISNSKKVLLDIIDRRIGKNATLMTFETDVKTIHRNRIETVDIAHDVLKKWLNSQKEYLHNECIKKLQSSVADVLDKKVASQLISCSVKYVEHLKQSNELVQAISPAHYVIETLMKLSNTVIESENYDLHNHLGVLAWLTLIKLACTYKTKYLGLATDEQDEENQVLHTPQDDIIDTIQVLLFDNKDTDNQKFSSELVKNEEKIIEYLIGQTKLKRIFCRSLQLRDNNFHAKFTLEGTRFSIEKCKDIIVSKNFFYNASQYKPFTLKNINSCS